MIEKLNTIKHARVAELADALDLGSSGLNRRGSNPLSRISLFQWNVQALSFTVWKVGYARSRNYAVRN